MSLLTPEAAEALHWMRKRMPNLANDYFMWDMEVALRTVLTRYGMDDQLVKAFNVEKIVCERDPVPVNPDTVKIMAQVYKHFTGFYAITDSGLVFRRVTHFLWDDCKYKPEYIRRACELVGEELINVEQLAT